MTSFNVSFIKALLLFIGTEVFTALIRLNVRHGSRGVKSLSADGSCTARLRASTRLISLTGGSLTAVIRSLRTVIAVDKSFVFRPCGALLNG